jgi:cephalosporin hydroxylase
MPSRLLRAAIDRIDALVMKRMATLLSRAEQGTGRRCEDVRNMLTAIVSDAPDAAYVEALLPVIGSAWDRKTGDIYASRDLRQVVVEQFHRAYYHTPAHTWRNTRYRGIPTAKCPLDLWIYQEILYEIQPEVIVETGTYYGGSALFLADVCNTIGIGKVITIDIKDLAANVRHARMTKLLGSSTDQNVYDTVKAHLADARSVMVILDSDHSYEHVRNELLLWSTAVTPGAYLIVEDTNINGHPVKPSFGPGPWEALHEFLESNDRFVIDDNREKFMLTFNPRGYLRRW